MINFKVLIIITSIFWKSYGVNPISFPNAKCQLITVDACKGLPYNSTEFPNYFGHGSQEEASNEINHYIPLTQVKCSPSLKLFLCSLYFPVCTRLKIPLLPCKSLCLQNKKGCEPLMTQFNFPWPRNMNCDNFPENQLCLRENNITKLASGPNLHGFDYSSGPVSRETFTCPPALQVPPKYTYKLFISANDTHINCGTPCSRHIFSNPSWRRFSSPWIGFWSGICVVTTLFTFLTFLIDTNRFPYPERPIIYMFACNLIIGVVYLVGNFLQDMVACSGPFASPNETLISTLQMPRLLTQGTMASQGCVVVFLVLYFATMASSVWWILLTINWYLAASCHWADESLALKAPYFQLVAWTVPSIQTILVLVWGGVDGDPLSGVCFTGLSDTRVLLFAVIFPLSFYCIVGSAFLLVGFLSMLRIRTSIKTSNGTTPGIQTGDFSNGRIPSSTPNHTSPRTTTDKLDKLILRIGLFSLLYIAPAVTVIGCYIYEWLFRADWNKTWLLDLCRSNIGDKVDMKNHPSVVAFKEVCAIHQRNLISIGESHKLPRPRFEIVMVRYLMQLMVGITSWLWVWSGKTVVAWRQLCCSCSKNGTRTTYTDSPEGPSVTCCCFERDKNRDNTVYSPASQPLNPTSHQMVPVSQGSHQMVPGPSSYSPSPHRFISPPGPPPSTSSVRGHPLLLSSTPSSLSWNDSASQTRMATIDTTTIV